MSWASILAKASSETNANLPRTTTYQNRPTNVPASNKEDLPPLVATIIPPATKPTPIKTSGWHVGSLASALRNSKPTLQPPMLEKTFSLGCTTNTTAASDLASSPAPVVECDTPLPLNSGFVTPPPLSRVNSVTTPIPHGATTYLDFSGDVDLDNFDVEAVHTNAVLLEDIHVKDYMIPDTHKSLAAQASKLSNLCFGECAIHRCSKKSGWKVTFLASPCEQVLFGFVAYRLKIANGCLEIGKLAVPEKLRRYGFGRRLMKFAMNAGKKHPHIGFVTLSSLPEAVPFYKRIGFKADENVTYNGVNLRSGEELVEGQVYMEYSVGGMKKIRKFHK